MDNFTRNRLDKVFNVTDIITIFYMEISKEFKYDGERHDYWEMVYIDKGEVICTAEENRFSLKSGEMTFHKPNEFHNLSGNGDVAPNVSIVSFMCKSAAMNSFEGKIFKLSTEEKGLLSMLFEEGLSCYRLEKENDPFSALQEKKEDAPFGGKQVTKNLLEVFLVRLCRHTDTVSKKARESIVYDGVDIPLSVKEIIDYLKDNLYARVTVGSVARALGKSESTVKQLFSLYRKDGIKRYYNSLKIKEAKKLLRGGRYNITQISEMLCFDNPQYFSKCFKLHTKMTPSEYKASIMG